MDRKFSINFSLNNSTTINNRENIKLKFSNPRVFAKISSSKKIGAKISDVLIIETAKPIDTGGEMPTTSDPSVTFEFNSNDVVNGKVRKYHGFDTKNVTVTVFDNLGVQVGTGVSIVDFNTVEIDLTRATVLGNWSLNIEKN